MTGIDERPLPPAAAYHRMADLLGDHYFATPPPARGLTLSVTGHDQVRTFWRIDAATAPVIAARARTHGLAVSSVGNYGPETPEHAP